MRTLWLLLGLLASAPALATEADLFVQNSSGTWVPASSAVPVPTTATLSGTVTVTGTVASTQSGTWTVQPGNTPNTTPWLETPTPATSGGLSVLRKQVAANTTSFAVDASAGQLYGIEAYNNGTTIAYVKLYNAAQGSTTCGSGTPVYQGMIPAPSSGGGGYISMNTMGIAFSTAITACVTTGFADNDATAPAATTYAINFFYK